MMQYLLEWAWANNCNESEFSCDDESYDLLDEALVEMARQKQIDSEHGYKIIYRIVVRQILYDDRDHINKKKREEDLSENRILTI